MIKFNKPLIQIYSKKYFWASEIHLWVSPALVNSIISYFVLLKFFLNS